MCHVYARSTYLWVFLDYHPTVLNCLWFLWLMEADILLACENWRWPRKKKKKSNNWILRLLLLSLPFLLSKGLQMFTYLKQQTHWLGQQDNELFFFLAKWSTVVANTREKEHVKTLAIYLEHSPWFAPTLFNFTALFFYFSGTLYLNCYHLMTGTLSTRVALSFYYYQLLYQYSILHVFCSLL